MVYALPDLLAAFAHRSDCPAIPPPPAARGGGIPRDIVEIVNSEPIQAERQTVTFFEGLSVDGYCLNGNEFRISITGASASLGFARNWLGRTLERDGNTVKALLGLGFVGEIKKVVTRSIRGGGGEALTISLDDFMALTIYAIQAKKSAAIALNKGFQRVSLETFFRHAFSMEALSIEEVRDRFYKTYAASISPRDWMEMDKDDVLRLALPGDEPHLAHGLWNT